jgi:hypothetical protein
VAAARRPTSPKELFYPVRLLEKRLAAHDGGGSTVFSWPFQLHPPGDRKMLFGRSSALPGEPIPLRFCRYRLQWHLHPVASLCRTRSRQPRRGRCTVRGAAGSRKEQRNIYAIDICPLRAAPARMSRFGARDNALNQDPIGALWSVVSRSFAQIRVEAPLRALAPKCLPGVRVVGVVRATVEHGSCTN